jgi:hypothetical protein
MSLIDSPAMPEQVGLVVGLAARPATRHDLSVPAQRLPRFSPRDGARSETEIPPALAPVIDHTILSMMS